MTARRKPVKKTEEPSRAAGACVLIVLAGVAVGALFAVDQAVGVLGVVFAGGVALYRSARRVSVSSATPPPPSGDTVYAVHEARIERVQEGPGEGMTILYPVREEVVDE
jgi:hypothetical protein